MPKKNPFSNFSFLKKPQQKIEELRKKLLELSRKEAKAEQQEREIIKRSAVQQNEVRIAISVESVVKATLAIFILIAIVQLLGMIKGVIILFLVALFLAAALEPAVAKMAEYRIPRALGLILVYVIGVGIFVILFSSLVPIIAEQIGQLALSIRGMIENLMTNPVSNPWFQKHLQPFAFQLWQNIDQAQVISQISNTLSGIASHLTNFAGNAVGAIFSLFNGLFNMILVLTITFFMVANSDHTKNFFHSLFPHRYSTYISLKGEQISLQIGEWIRGQLIIALFTGILSFAVFGLIGLNYTLTLSLLSAITQLIPYLGPLITFCAAALIALNQSPIMLVWLIAGYFVIQFFISNILGPMVMGKSGGLNPVVVIFAMLSGATVGFELGGSFGMGVIGMILAVPAANIISLFVQDFTGKKQELD